MPKNNWENKKEEVKTIRTLRDENCPKCGWPETITIREETTMKPLEIECGLKRKGKCDWSQKVKYEN